MNYYWYFLLTWLPLYLVRERHFSMDKMATVVVHLPCDRRHYGGRGMAVGSLDPTGLLGKPGVPVREMAVFGLLASTIILPVATIENPTAAMAVLVAACMGFGVLTSNHWAITQTLAGSLFRRKMDEPAKRVWQSGRDRSAFGNGICLCRRRARSKWHLLSPPAVALIGALMYGLVIGKVEQVEFDSVKTQLGRSRNVKCSHATGL